MRRCVPGVQRAAAAPVAGKPASHRNEQLWQIATGALPTCSCDGALGAGGESPAGTRAHAELCAAGALNAPVSYAQQPASGSLRARAPLDRRASLAADAEVWARRAHALERIYVHGEARAVDGDDRELARGREVGGQSAHREARPVARVASLAVETARWRTRFTSGRAAVEADGPTQSPRRSASSVQRDADPVHPASPHEVRRAVELAAGGGDRTDGAASPDGGDGPAASDHALRGEPGSADARRRAAYSPAPSPQSLEHAPHGQAERRARASPSPSPSRGVRPEHGRSLSPPREAGGARSTSPAPRPTPDPEPPSSIAPDRRPFRRSPVLARARAASSSPRAPAGECANRLRRERAGAERRASEAAAKQPRRSAPQRPASPRARAGAARLGAHAALPSPEARASARAAATNALTGEARGENNVTLSTVLDGAGARPAMRARVEALRAYHEALAEARAKRAARRPDAALAPPDVQIGLAP